ncbi:unnamed protein product, partial [Lepidochelys olivacea]
LRLVNGSSRCAGRVEVFHNKKWGTVCDGGWDLQDAGIVCRQLGCGTALSAPAGAHFGQGSDHIWLDNVTCTGTEVALSDCRARSWGDSNCTHGEDAGVECSDSGISEVAQLRLVNSSSHCAGRVEVLHNQQWGTVCDDSWDITDAGVVCRQLGCGTALSAPGRARFGRGSDRVWLDDVHCTGTEAALSDCRSRPWGDNNCNHGEDAGVVCSGKLLSPLLQGADHCPNSAPPPLLDLFPKSPPWPRLFPEHATFPLPPQLHETGVSWRKCWKLGGKAGTRRAQGRRRTWSGGRRELGGGVGSCR